MRDKAVEVWPGIVQRLEDRLGLVRTSRWLPLLVIDDNDADGVTIYAPNERCASQARKNKTEIQRELTQALNLPDRVPLTIQARPMPSAATARTRARTSSRHLRPVRSSTRRMLKTDSGALSRPSLEPLPAPRLNPQNSLSRFVTEVNDLALKFSRHVASEPGGDYNPLVLFGPSGVGKTHLSQGAAMHFRKLFPEKRVVVQSVNNLAVEFGLAKQNGFDAFRRKTRHLDFLVLDDIQSLTTKKALQQELIHIFDSLSAHSGQVLVTCDRSPRLIPELHESLKSRLVSGVCVELKVPDLEERLRILEAHQNKLKLSLRKEVLEFLAQKVADNPGDLLGAFTKLAAYSELVDRDVDLATAKRALTEILGVEQHQASASNIARLVSQCLQVPVESILGGSRRPQVVKARQLAMTLTRKLTKETLAEIGATFGKRSTGAVHFALKRMRQVLPEDDKLRQVAEDVTRHFMDSEAIDWTDF